MRLRGDYAALLARIRAPSPCCHYTSGDTAAQYFPCRRLRGPLAYSNAALNRRMAVNMPNHCTRAAVYFSWALFRANQRARNRFKARSDFGAAH